MKERVSPVVMCMLPKGKYTAWAEKLSSHGLLFLLEVIGIFGREYVSFVEQAGVEPKPIFMPNNMAEGRMANAVRCIGRIYQGRLPAGTHDPCGLDDQTPVFTPEFRAYIARMYQYLWATNISEARFHALLWQVGEYGVRASCSLDANEYPSPTFEPVGPSVERMRRCLRVLVALRYSDFDSLAASRFIGSDSGELVPLHKPTPRRRKTKPQQGDRRE